MNCPPDTDTPGFAIENETKPEETHLISETAGLFHPKIVARYKRSIPVTSLSEIKILFHYLTNLFNIILIPKFFFSRQLVEDTLQGKFLSTSGFDGWVATTLSSGLINSSFKDALTQSFLMGPLRLGTWFTVRNFYTIIQKCHQKRNHGKKLA